MCGWPTKNSHGCWRYLYWYYDIALKIGGGALAAIALSLTAKRIEIFGKQVEGQTEQIKHLGEQVKQQTEQVTLAKKGAARQTEHNLNERLRDAIKLMNAKSEGSKMNGIVLVQKHLLGDVAAARQR